MILGFIVGLILNFYVSDPFIKDTILATTFFIWEEMYSLN